MSGLFHRLNEMSEFNVIDRKLVILFATFGEHIALELSPSWSNGNNAAAYH